MRLERQLKQNLQSHLLWKEEFDGRIEAIVAGMIGLVDTGHS